ncbi:flocculation protein FLO11-like [Diaphorina citri]|uniref:Flocculation protein FLO11-like n=1 Tax=Diaphorina citri TaxID=121845 RepID=A0A3Q0JE29_DIACI|nr:flocculation protein FLO11-like [Diaphorina citri]
MHMSATELDKQLLLFHYQTKLVSTIVSTSDEMANRSSTRVPTLFGGADEKAALLLDIISLDMGREDGTSQKYRDLCKETVSALKLNPVSIYSELVRLLAKQSRLQDIKDMIASLKQDLGRSCDDILVAAIRQKPAQVEQLICLLSKIPLQISMFIEAGKLKSAYLLSVKHNRLDDIRIIAQQAKLLNQTTILNICTKKIALEESKLTESEQNRKSEEEAKQKGPKYDSKNGSVREKTGAKSSTSGNIRQSGDGQPSTSGNVRQSGNSQRISSSESTPSSSQDRYQGKAGPSKLSTEQSSYASIASVLKAYEQKSTKERSDASKTKTVYVQDKPESSSNFDSIASVLKAYQQKSLQQTASPKSKTVSAQGKTESSSEFDSIASVLKAYEQKSPKSYAFSRSDTSKGSISSSPKRRDEQYGSASKKILKSKKDHGISRGRVLETSSSKSDDPSPSKIAQERDSSRLTSRDSGLASSVERPSGVPLESPSNFSKLGALGSNRTPSGEVSKPDQSKPSSSSSSQGTSEQGQSKGKVSTGQGGPQESPSRLKSRLNIFKPS